MKYLISLLFACLVAGCATKKETTSKISAVVPGTNIPSNRVAAIRTPEVVKAYSVGRYSDPNSPDEMHERHTVYRREQSPDWNYLPDPPPIPATESHPSSSNVGAGPLSAKQRAYAEALQEQNRAMQKRIEALQQEVKKLPGLQSELERLRKEPEEPSQSEPSLEPAAPPIPEERQDVLSGIEPDLPPWEMGVSDPGEISLFAESVSQDDDFLFSQMRINDEFAAELAAAEQRRISVMFSHPFLRRRELALLFQ